jgi:anthranilate synthase
MSDRFTTKSGILIERTTTVLPYAEGIRHMIDALDHERGVFLSSGIDYPGRYNRWEIGFIRPPLEIVSKERELHVRALSRRGIVLVELLSKTLAADPAVALRERTLERLRLEVAPGSGVFPEEERSLQPSVFTPLRALLEDFKGIDDGLLGLYGAFGYDLIFQFERIARVHPRAASAKGMHLFLPDRLYQLDRRKESLTRHDYVFSRAGRSTRDADDAPLAPLPRPRLPKITSEPTTRHTTDDFAALVERARERMHRGDIYQIVLARCFSLPHSIPPSVAWRSMTALNPSPYELLCQFGDEQLVGTSPEMFIRVTGDRVESCPISGTVRRGANPMEDAEAIRRLLNSDKDEVELTMCTDVDRNDKARICVAGSVKLLERRVIERYAGLAHTVDHVEGRLRPGMTGIDAFLSHMWAVTLTGSPKPMAVRLIEQMEIEPRGWYGGAVGALLFNGDVSTGITIRTLHSAAGHTHYRTGASLVYDSNGYEEELETRTKASVFFHLLKELRAEGAAAPAAAAAERPGAGLRLLLIDNEDSFVHILADYFRQTGAEVTTYRHGLDLAAIRAMAPDLVVHSPGPGWPAEFGVPRLVSALADAGIAQFGVCLGLQGIVEAFGGRLSLLDRPRQGKRWTITHDGKGLFQGLPSPCQVGAYHALYADDAALPSCLEVLARNEGGIVMAVRHRDLPVSAVQFHPESILSLTQSVGHRLIANLVREIRETRRLTTAAN